MNGAASAEAKMFAKPAQEHLVYIVMCKDDVVFDLEVEALPSAAVEVCWNSTASAVSLQIFGDPEVLASARLVKLLRMWYPLFGGKDEVRPPESTYLTRATFVRTLTESERDQLQIKGPRYAWRDVEGLLASGLLDPETGDLVAKLAEAKDLKIAFGSRELNQSHFILVDPESSTEAAAADQRKGQAQLMAAAGFNTGCQERVFAAFFSRSFPKLYLSRRQFNDLMSTLGWAPQALPHLFRSFNVRRPEKAEGEEGPGCPRVPTWSSSTHLSFPELICGLAVCDPNTPHANYPGEARSRYIFRYYDRSCRGALDFEDFSQMVRDIRHAKGLPIDDDKVLEEASISARVFGSDEGSVLLLNDFLTSVGQLKFRGTSLLLRSPVVPLIPLLPPTKVRQVPPRGPKAEDGESAKVKVKKGTTKSTLSPPAAAKRPRFVPRPDVDDENASGSASDHLRDDGTGGHHHHHHQDLQHQFSFESGGDLEDGSLSGSYSNFATASEGQGDDYDFATHVVKVKRSGHINDVRSLWELEEDGSEAISHSSRFSPELRSNYGRMLSIRAFSAASDANEMLRGLRYFEKGSKKDSDGDCNGSDLPNKGHHFAKPRFSWGTVDMKSVASSLIDLSQQVRHLFLHEPRMIRVKAPTYILGDLHGNFRDLVCFEKVLWRMGPQVTAGNFLFLGDYVDRGAHGVEVVAYLFAQKVVAPNKFHLLRGNHEVRAMQRNFTFHAECLSKFGPDLGRTVWEKVNLAFDAMPLAAVVDDKILCVHGGIPPPWLLQQQGSSKGEGQQQDHLAAAIEKVKSDLPDPEGTDPLAWEILWNDPLNRQPPTHPEAEDEEDAVLPLKAQCQMESLDYQGFVDNFRRGTGHMFDETALRDFLNKNQLTHLIRAHEVKKAGFQVQMGGKLLTVFSSSHYCDGSNEAACVLVDNRKLRLIRIDTG